MEILNPDCDQKIRKLAIDAYGQIDPPKRDNTEGIKFFLPAGLKSLTREDARQAVNAVHGYRFAGEENTPEARNAVGQYYILAGNEIIYIFFSKEPWQKKCLETHTVFFTNS